MALSWEEIANERMKEINRLRSAIREQAEEMKQAEIEGAKKYQMFIFNFPHQFLQKIFTENMANHLQPKFNAYYDREGSTASVPLLVADLSEGYKKEFFNFVVNNPIR